MNQENADPAAEAWSEAQQRAENYLRAVYGEFGPAECELLMRAMQTAREQEENVAHPVALVMHALFALFPQEPIGPMAMTPPMQRVSMLPEKIEFPFHEGLRRLFRTRLLPFAGAN